MLRVPSSTVSSKLRYSRCVPHLHGAAVARPRLADAHAFGVVAVRAERRGAAGADPLVAALVALLLFLAGARAASRAACPSRRATRSAPSLLPMSVRSASALQPVRGHLGDELRRTASRRRRNLREHAVEAIVVALVLHETGAREIVEVLRGQPAPRARFSAFEQRQELGDGHRHAGCAQLEEESAPSTAAAPSARRGGAGTPAARTGARPARSSAARRSSGGIDLLRIVAAQRLGRNVLGDAAA